MSINKTDPPKLSIDNNDSGCNVWKQHRNNQPDAKKLQPIGEKGRPCMPDCMATTVISEGQVVINIAEKGRPCMPGSWQQR